MITWPVYDEFIKMFYDNECNSTQELTKEYTCIDYNVDQKNDITGVSGWPSFPNWNLILFSTLNLSPIMRKPVFRVCDQVRHKLACTVTEARQRLEISDIESRGITLSRQRATKVLIRLRGCAG